MALARKEGFDVREEFLTIYDLMSADEVFLTGTAAEVIGVRSLDERKIGSGSRGPVTKQIVNAFKRETENGVPFDSGVAVAG
jgi:branched-chain amino acid aminotransferase